MPPGAMIICKVWDAEYPWDVRVEKVCSALRGAGHEVHLVARNRDGRALREALDVGVVHRMQPLPRPLRRLNSASMFPAFFNPRWVGLIQRVAEEQNATLILCRDLPLAPTSLLVARRLGIPLVVDLAEDYPAMLAQLYNRRDFRLHNLLVRNPLLAQALEKYVVRRADGILVVAEESAARVAALGAPRSRIEIVGNTPTADRVAAMPHAHVPAGAGAALRLVYLGLLETARGMDLMLDGLAATAGTRTIILDLFGSDPDGLWQRRADALGVRDRVTFHGYVAYDRVLGRLHEFDVGVMPHHLSRHIRTTLPNKLYDYMAAGLPVLASDAAPVRRLLEEEHCGIVFRDRDVADFLAGCARLADAGLRRSMGEAGRCAVEQRHNWSVDAARLTGFIEHVAAGAPARV